MRYLSRVQHSDSNLVFLRAREIDEHDEPQLTTFRGLLIAASLSALLWGMLFTAVWFLRSRA